jgi:thioredoxin-like negative regulator of GroEL
MAPVFDRLSERLGAKLVIAKVDADANPALVEELKVQGVPTIIFYVDGVSEKRIIGAQPRMAIEQLIDTYFVDEEDAETTI